MALGCCCWLRWRVRPPQHAPTLRACRHLRTELMNKARQRAAPLVIEDKAAAINAMHQGGGAGAGGGGGGEGMGIDTDEALNLLLAAWRMHRQQQVEMHVGKKGAIG